jgi:hypothetical protein
MKHTKKLPVFEQSIKNKPKRVLPSGKPHYNLFRVEFLDPDTYQSAPVATASEGSSIILIPVNIVGGIVVDDSSLGSITLDGNGHWDQTTEGTPFAREPWE